MRKRTKLISRKIILLLIISLAIISVNSAEIIDINQKVKQENDLYNLKTSNNYWIPVFTLPVGKSPHSVSVADANNDGYNDIVTSLVNLNNVSILLWNSTKDDWDQQIQKSVGDRPEYMFVEDVNNDGYDDIVTANLESSDISILLWNSTANDWDVEQRKTLIDHPRDLFIEDVDNDGHKDIITIHEDYASLFLWNSTLSNWNPLLEIPVGNNNKDLVIADADNDGLNDIMATGYHNTVSILLWNSIMEDWEPEIQRNVSHVDLQITMGLIKDANNDGYNDIIAIFIDPTMPFPDYGSSNVSILLWNPIFEDWDPPIQIALGEVAANSIFVGDVNNDGYNDIITSNTHGMDMLVLLWNSTSDDWDPIFHIDIGSLHNRDLVIADANNDGYNDIVAHDNNREVIILLWNTPPSIIINQPLDYAFFEDIAPDYNITIKDYDLDSVWYTLDDGITNITISHFWGRINQSIWDNQDDGTVIIKFYANDSAGQIGYAGVTVGKNLWDPPDPPINIMCYSGYRRINLTWNEPPYSAPIDRYLIYRSTISGGVKIFIGSSLKKNFTDYNVEFNKQYYYEVRAENLQGESNASEEVSCIAGPYIRWQKPYEKENVILPVGDAIFNFSCDYRFLDEIRLFLNNRDYGSIKGKSSIILTPYNSSIDGQVNAVIYGYEEGNPIPIVNDSRNFIFGKLITDVYELLEEDTQYIGEKLYLILHDPNGDNSYSWFEETSIVSMGVGLEVATEYGDDRSIGVILDVPYIGIDFGATQNIRYKETSEEGFDFRYEIVDTTQVFSSQEKSDADYIGPGYGDRYWGEAWTLKWALKAYHRLYFNGTERYEEANLHYGIIRSQEVMLNDYNAPGQWRAQNPAQNGWKQVEWIDNLTIDGGSPFLGSYEVFSTETTSWSHEITLEEETMTNLFIYEETVTFTLRRKWYAETAITDSYTVGYTIYDDESTDTISYEYGIDKKFGTFIFRSNEFFCETSYPLEHNTYDYLPPIIDFPHIELDSNQDGIAPCKDDTPLVTVEIFDEGGIQSALIYFSTNDGLTWDTSILSEQIANLGTWDGLIPAQDHGATVLWFIRVWDNGGSYSNRTDPHGNPFKYMVINRAPTIHITIPNGNEVFENTVRIEWSAMDLDGDNLTFTIAYNLANTGWHLIESGISRNYYDWDISGLEFCDTVLIKVTVDDGFGGNAYDESDYVFTIGEQEPTISKPSEVNWNLILVIAFISLTAALSTIVIFIRRSRSIQE